MMVFGNKSLSFHLLRGLTGLGFVYLSIHLIGRPYGWTAFLQCLRHFGCSRDALCAGRLGCLKPSLTGLLLGMRSILLPGCRNVIPSVVPCSQPPS